ncbi:mechanosensitive ion channel family protein [Novosphingobium aquimarinum]|uniref:mechanosensitive ion channel family protein n=1 Tax=Novosphingobium aquimarinum TaxID=2682494 RepID=UPI0012EBCDC9|nr:mechanosensitive ion channel domain-containing protein [Novosphingobium aquimarinum]
MPRLERHVPARKDAEEETIEAIETIQDYVSANLWAKTLVGLAGVLLLAWMANWLTKKLVVRPVTALIARTPLRNETHDVQSLVTHLANVVPAIIIMQGFGLIEGMPEKLVVVVAALANAFIIFTLARALCDLLELANDTYELKPEAASRPIKGYLQVGKILIYAAAVVLITATLIGESPVILLSGLGALAAVLMLVFRDTILSLVASVQLRSNDMLRVGDWIDMPQLNADGDVIDISLHTVKVQNFDKSVTTIPTHSLVSEAYRNWRFMREWGGRRIKRSLYVDQTTIDFVEHEDWERLRRFRLLQDYMARKEAELAEWNDANAKACGGEPVNKRRPTNIGTFRAYVRAYLSAHPRIADRGTLLVRQLEPSGQGLPLEIYCFTDTVAWDEYEGIQSDIFDHLLAIMPQFGLKLFQAPTGHDLRGIEWPRAQPAASREPATSAAN